MVRGGTHIAKGGAVPSRPHEVPISLFRTSPKELFGLLQKQLPQNLPAFDEIKAEDANFTQLDPVEYRADLVLVFYKKEEGNSQRPVMGIVLEVQLAEDKNKLSSWPLYAAALFARLKCPTFLVVVCLEEAVAQWAGRSIAGFHGGCFAPFVLGPTIPKLMVLYGVYCLVT